MANRDADPRSLLPPEAGPSGGPFTAPFTGPLSLISGDATATYSAVELRTIGEEIQRFMLTYHFGLREVETKVEILRDEFQHMHAYNPIEHVSGRVKSVDSIMAKITRRGIAPDIASIREHITDIAGVRVTCCFVDDAYRLFDLLTRQDDITVRTVKDYIADPKPNGYKSLHAVVDVPVFLSSGAVPVTVELQFRTIAMDFWASLEHRIHYKFAGHVPDRLVAELKEAADTAAELDARMERLHREIHGDAHPRG